MRFYKSSFLAMLLVVAMHAASSGQGLVCDPSRVMTSDSCAKCHGAEVRVWRSTPHHQTFNELVRNPEAQAICDSMGLKSIKRSNVCVDCHFTLKEINGKAKPVSGISCESCHGASRDWLAVHNEYGGPTATKESETEEHRQLRLKLAADLGMNNTRDLYSIAMNCYSCHMVPNEALVNVGGHKPGTSEFELVRYSQGKVRHNFLRSDGAVNAKPTQSRLRVMFVVGLIADLEFSTRATAIATEKSKYGINVAQRAARSALRLNELQQKLNDPHVAKVLAAFSKAELRTNNAGQLGGIADAIQQAGREFASQTPGGNLEVVDELLPSPDQYR